MAYLLDTNVFIQANKLHYGLDFCPAFWEWLDRESQATGPEVFDALPVVARWAQSRPYTEAAINTFLQEADYFLIGRALAHGDVLVTQEISRPDRRNRVMIPDACLGVGVKFMSPFTMLRVEKARFVLA